MYRVVLLLCQQLDRVIAAKVPSYKPVLTAAIERTRKLKGRLLYYYPTDDKGASLFVRAPR